MSTALEGQIAEWRRFVGRRATISAADVDEMEAHLRDQVEDLVGVGLAQDEAFLVAVKRLGGVDELSREFAREHSERLWKQLLPPVPAGTSEGRRQLGVLLAFAVSAGLALRAGIAWLPEEAAVRNGPLLVLPFLAGWLAWRHHAGPRLLATGAAVLLVTAVALNAYPFHSTDETQAVAVAHLPVLLWLVAGLGYVGTQWRSSPRRMDFIRFTGEWVVYYALLALGGGVLMGLTAASFAALDLHVENFLATWVLPPGAAGAVLVAAWLVEAKQSVVENMAPVLVRVFTPLTLLLLVALLAAFLAGGNPAHLARELLVLIDLVLVLVLGLVLYAISARDPLAPPTWFDTLQLVVVAAALVVDVVALGTMVTRIADAGASANKLAALGLNLVLLVNLVRSLQLGARFVRGRTGFAALERWQTGYVPVYPAWAAVAIVVLPPVFGFA